MLNITIIDQFNNKVSVELVRYFKTNIDTYLIYSLNEVDESGFVKLYAAKLIENKDFEKVESEIEWNQVKDLIKTIVKESKDGVMSVEDLDYTKLENANIMSNRVFKLTSAVKDMLGANKKEFKQEEKLEELVFETPSTVDEDKIEERISKKITTLEDLLNDEPFKMKESFIPTPLTEVHSELDETVKDLQAKIDEYEAKLNKIREIIK